MSASQRRGHGDMNTRRLRGNGITKLPSGRYQITYRDRLGVRHRESFDREKEARAALDEKRTEVRKGEYIAPRSVPLFHEAAKRWLDGKRDNASRTGKPVKETTLKHWRNHIDRYLNPTFERYTLDQITTEIIEEKRTEWRDGRLSPQTVNKLLTTLAAVFDEAIRWGKIKQNPAARARRLAVGSMEAAGQKENGEVKEADVYNPNELGRLIAAADPGLYRTAIMLICSTGMRSGEALALQWGDIDLQQKRLTVRRSWPDLRDKNGEPIFYVPKTRNGVREIPIPDELASTLKTWKLQCPPSRWDLVLPKADGRPEDRKTMLRGLWRAIRRAGVKKLDVHSLRHSYASIMLSQGAPITEVSAYLGHANPQITLAIYSHWLPRTRTNSVDKLAAAIFDGGRVVHLKTTSGQAEDEVSSASS